MFSFLAVAALQVAAASPAEVSVSTAEDCAVYAALAKAKHDWADLQPKIAAGEEPAGDHDGFLNVISYGSVRFRVDCDWRRLGVHPPKMGDAQARSGFSLSRPKFSADGLSAQVHASTFVEPGWRRAAAVSDTRCVLKKSNNVWHLVECNDVPIRTGLE